MSAPDAVPDRFDIRLLSRQDEGGEGRELPMRILVLGAFSGQRRPSERVESRTPVLVTASSLTQVMTALRPHVRLTVDDALSGEGQTTIEVQFTSLDDFSPDQVIRALPAASALLETRSGITALMAEAGDAHHLVSLVRAVRERHPHADPATLAGLLDAHERSQVGSPAAQRGLAAVMRAGAVHGDATALLDRTNISGLIADIDRRLSAQTDAVLHHPEFRALEARWRGMVRLAVRTDRRNGLLVDLLDVSKEELRDDFEDSSDITRSGLFKVVYAGEYGQHGGQPYALLATDWSFSASQSDLALLTRMAAVAAMAHAPLLAAADPALLGLRSFDRLEDLHDLGALLNGPAYTKWRAFRASEDARYVGLILPGVLLRTPWGDGASGAATFSYREGGDGRLWGGGACALASRMAASFARWRWCAEAVGPGAGAIENLPLHNFTACGKIESRLAVESWISEARAAQFADEGLIAIASLRGSGESGFLTAPSCRQASTFARDAAGRAAAMSERLGMHLPWLMLACRFAHCLKVMQRERIGSATSREDLEHQLEEWLLRYVVDMDQTDAATRQSSPLRAARLRVEDVPGAAGWYRINLSITPHVRHLGTSFSLAVVGRLDRPGIGLR